MSQFIGTSMTPGYAGDLTRGLFDATIETKVNDGTVKAFGVPVKLSSGKAAAVSAASDAVYGFSVREYGQADNDGVQEMYQILLKQREEGKLIVVASHSSEDIRVLCNEIFHFDKGKMIDHQIAEK